MVELSGDGIFQKFIFADSNQLIYPHVESFEILVDYINQILKDNFTRYYNDAILLDIYRKNIDDLPNTIQTTNICICQVPVGKKWHNVNSAGRPIKLKED